MSKIFKTAGVDEVGRGCLAGPVFAAAVILNNKIDKKDIIDSKKIPFKERDYGSCIRYIYIFPHINRLQLAKGGKEYLCNLKAARATNFVEVDFAKHAAFRCVLQQTANQISREYPGSSIGQFAWR